MKVLLIKPTSYTDGITPPLGLGYLATAIRDAHEVKIVDGPKIHLNRRKFAQILEAYKPDLIGFSVISLDLDVVASYLKLARELLPDAVTVVGGPHPSGDPEEAFYNYIPDLDFAFVGESETGLRMLADFFDEGAPGESELKSVPGLVWKEGVKFHKNPAYFEEDLDSLGFPAWDLMDPRSYPPAPHSAFARAFPVANISSSRGCPFGCAFCAAHNVQGKKLRRRSVSHIMEEIDFLVRKYGARELHIIDDNFTHNRDYALEFCERLARSPHRLTWTCPNGIRLDSLDHELLTAMKRSGCYALAVGIESGSQAVLDNIGKKQTVELVRERVRMINGVGIQAIGFFGIGFPGETAREIRNTIDLSLELPLIRAQYMFFHPMPGTEQYRDIIETHPEKLRAVYSYLGNIAYVEDGLTESQLRWLHRSAFLRFYLRPRQFFQLIASIRGPRHAYYIMRRIIRWMVLS